MLGLGMRPYLGRRGRVDAFGTEQELPAPPASLSRLGTNGLRISRPEVHLAHSSSSACSW